MEIQGKIKLIGETQTVGSNGFRKRELVVTTEEQYPQHLSVDFVQDKTDLLNNFQVGQQVKVGINLRGREWVSPQGETKHFDYVCQGVTQGIKDLNVLNDVPVIFCLLTDNNMQQSLDRSGGKLGNKGVEAAITALKMAALSRGQ